MSRRIVDGAPLPPDIEEYLDSISERGYASEDEAHAAVEFFSRLADRELAGEITRDDAVREIADFADLQLASRSEVKS
jgi:hypothetical protein